MMPKYYYFNVFAFLIIIFKITRNILLDNTSNVAVCPPHVIIVPLSSRGVWIVRVTLMEELVSEVTVNTRVVEHRVATLVYPT